MTDRPDAPTRSLDTLHEAFTELERRADNAPPHQTGEHRARPARWIAPVGAAALVAAAAVVVAVITNRDDHSTKVAPGAQLSAPTSTAPSSPTPRSSPTSAPRSSPSSVPTSRPKSVPPSNAAYQPPGTGAELAARARQILGDTATIEVTYASGGETTGPRSTGPTSVAASSTGSARNGRSMPLHSGSAPAADDGSGSAIVGTLTAGGQTGGFDLNVFRAADGARAECASDVDTCETARPAPNGGTLAVGRYDLSAGGVTYAVECISPDGADVLFHLSTERDPKGESPVTADHLPLTVDQMIAFASSSQW